MTRSSSATPSLKKSPSPHERQEQLLQDQIDEIMMGITELKESNGERFSIKQLEKSKKQLEIKLQKLKAEERKDDVVTFEQLGVDRLYVDEAHPTKTSFCTPRCAMLPASPLRKHRNPLICS